MVKITLNIDGMACSMCEAHINDCIRKEFPVKKVTSSHSKGQTVILADAPLDEARLRAAIAETGYTLQNVSVEAAEEKKGFLHFLHRT